MRITIAVMLAIALALPLSAAPKIIQTPPQHPVLDASRNGELRTTNVLMTVKQPPFDLKSFADGIEKNLKGNCAGYQFVVSWGTAPMQKRAGGAARRAPDASPRNMTVNDRYNIASVSKTLTAAAAMKLLSQKKTPNIRSVLDTPMIKYLPPSFKPGANVDKVTFRQLLTHTSGIRCNTEVTYDNLQKCVGSDINPADKVYQYNNSNFALFRILIPRLAGTMPAPGANKNTDSFLYGIDYMRYVQANVFTPSGVPVIGCKPSGNSPAQCYQHPGPAGAGTDFGDMTETNASRGWTLSSLELGQVFSHLLYTDKVLPQGLVTRMEKEKLGLYPDVLTADVSAYSHGGYYPGKDDKGNLYNPGELNSLVFGLTDGVSVAVIVNSQIYDAVSKKNLDLYTIVRNAAVAELAKK
jgi:CubicO group peptidase (beta-lactamase class C family)